MSGAHALAEGKLRDVRNVNVTMCIGSSMGGAWLFEIA